MCIEFFPEKTVQFTLEFTLENLPPDAAMGLEDIMAGQIAPK